MISTIRISNYIQAQGILLMSYVNMYGEKVALIKAESTIMEGVLIEPYRKG